MMSEYYIEFCTWNGTHTGTFGPFKRLTDAETELGDIRTNGVYGPERFGLDRQLTHQGDAVMLTRVKPGAAVGVIKQEWIRTNGAWQRAKPRVDSRVAMQFNFAKEVKPAPGLEYFVTGGYSGKPLDRRGPYQELSMAQKGAHVLKRILDHDQPGEAAWCRIMQEGKLVEEYVRKPGEAAWKKVGEPRTWFVVRYGGDNMTPVQLHPCVRAEVERLVEGLQKKSWFTVNQGWIRVAEVPDGHEAAPDETWQRYRGFQRKADGTWISATAASDGSYAGPGPYADPQISKDTPAPVPPQKTWRRVERPVIFKFKRPGETLEGTFVRLNEVVTADGNFETVILKGPNETRYSVGGIMLIDLVRNADPKPGTPMKIKYTGTQDTESGYPMKVYELYTADE